MQKNRCKRDQFCAASSYEIKGRRSETDFALLTFFGGSLESDVGRIGQQQEGNGTFLSVTCTGVLERFVLFSERVKPRAAFFSGHSDIFTTIISQDFLMFLIWLHCLLFEYSKKRCFTVLFSSWKQIRHVCTNNGTVNRRRINWQISLQMGIKLYKKRVDWLS